MQVLDAIIDWAERLPDWQSDALRRLWTQDEYSDNDFESTFSLLVRAHGLDGETRPAPQAKRFTREHVAAHSASESQTTLLGMHDLMNVNALATDQRLEFGCEGVTVVFGENASGKSGYSRVLKHACRARGTKEPVHPDVFTQSPSQGSPEALFDIQIGNAGQSVRWSHNSVPSEALSDIAVFDSKCARVYVDDANDVAYIPYGLDVLGDLARVCERLRRRIREEVGRLPEPPRILDELIGEGKPLATLTARTSADEIRRAATFTENDDERLSGLTRQLAELTAADPKKKAEEWRRLRQRIDRLRQDLLVLKASVSSNSLQRLETIRRNAVAAQEAARLASDKAFAHEPLPGTGGEAWRIMFEAARRFSEESAYPERPYPVTDNGSRCVLCQQPLDEESGDRLRRFWDFLQAETTQTAAARRKELSDATEKFNQPDFDIESRHQGLLEEISELEPGTDALTRSYLKSLILRAMAISSALASGVWALPQLSADPWHMLSRASKRCQSEVDRFERATKEDPKPALQKEKEVLEWRKLYADNMDVLIKRVGEIQRHDALEMCFKDADTTGITRKHSELMNQALTQELKDALDAEKSELGIGYIPIKLNRSGAVGTTRHQLALDSAGYQGIGMSDILSEGEHRMVAIASFLAELQTSQHRCGIIFDDPVSSLDHKWRERVARRLVMEGLKRQVIIFTHDIAFLFAVEQEAAQQQVHLTVQSVLRAGKSVGVTNPDVPWHAMNVGKRIGFLNNMVQQLTTLNREGESPGCATRVGEFYGRLRDAWEKAVEEILFAAVVQRFRKEVQTKMLKSVEVTNDDYKLVFRGMEKCSDRMTGHNSPVGCGPSVPTPDELKADLDQLDRFVKDVRERQKRLEPVRKKLLEAPTPADRAPSL